MPMPPVPPLRLDDRRRCRDGADDRDDGERDAGADATRDCIDLFSIGAEMSETLRSKLRGAWKSATIWFNTFALALIPLFDALQAGLPMLREYGDGRFFAVFAMTVLVGNILLRFKTNSDLRDK
jgi:hypothetical protein